MEKKLKALFDYQKFENNTDLQRIIDSVHARYTAQNTKRSIRELSLDEVEWVAAAGMPGTEKKKNEPD